MHNFQLVVVDMAVVVDCLRLQVLVGVLGFVGFGFVAGFVAGSAFGS